LTTGPARSRAAGKHISTQRYSSTVTGMDASLYLIPWHDQGQTLQPARPGALTI